LKRQIIIRADGGASIGMGHIIRCLALADMLKDHFLVSFAIQDPVKSVIDSVHSVTNKIIKLPATSNYIEDAANFCSQLNSNDIIVLDGYHFTTEYQKAVKEKGCKVIAIDDLHAWHQMADVVINHSEGVAESDYSKEPYTKLCLGLDYVLLRKEFLNTDKILRHINAVKKIFISMGAADINNLTQKFAEAIVDIKGIEEIHLMLGDINPNLKSIEKFISGQKNVKIISHFNISAKELVALLKECDISICPASSISLESCAIGIGLVSGFTAENQQGILNGLKKNEATIDLGDLNKISRNEIKMRFQSLLAAPSQLNDIIRNQKRMIDGKSPERLNNIFNNLLG
jgi:UDP-2,4-diacetamido-2,4,6-trideoxy-beta-L-altropyranose hydrolase